MGAGTVTESIMEASSCRARLSRALLEIAARCGAAGRGLWGGGLVPPLDDASRGTFERSRDTYGESSLPCVVRSVDDGAVCAIGSGHRCTLVVDRVCVLRLLR